MREKKDRGKGEGGARKRGGGGKRESGGEGREGAVGATQFGVLVSVAKFCVKQLCRVLCTNFWFWISFPNPNELGSVSQEFEGLTGLPHCCGVLHCTRFEVVSPRDPPSPPSPVAAQLVVDSSCRILSVAAGFFGRKSNSRILKSSSLFRRDIIEFSSG
ncbi:hypothetical protein Ahy_B09g097321 [Arachis hypogaea]|uniref:Uncharacterized protein n=1 Tax=Arachis hypogaea TaxID=3818 RepID=A0A444XPB2_ARAHY|nr:hypothetical protein Ahy_B09g097321 [Arachis hypogaea]